VLDLATVSLAIRGAVHRALRKGTKQIVFDFDHRTLFEGTGHDASAFTWLRPEEVGVVFAAVRRMFGIPAGIHEFQFAPIYRYNPQLAKDHCDPRFTVNYDATHIVTVIFDEPGKRLVFNFRIIKEQTHPALPTPPQRTTEPLFRRR